MAYTLSMLSELAKRRKACVDFPGIWNAQGVNAVLESSIAVVSRVVNEDIIRPPAGISNISEWCKREACWTRIQTRIEDVEKLLQPEVYDQLQ